MIKKLSEAEREQAEVRLITIERDFLSGNLDALRLHRCPYCREGKLFFSLSQGTLEANAPPGRRRRCGSTIYCNGECNYMLSHMDGFCPAWAEDITDWKEFSASLYI